MKQAIQERFILDVLAHYTTVPSYYKLAKTIEDDPEFDSKKAKKKLARYVQGHDHAIQLKAEIMVDHFHDNVLAKGKIGAQARAMIVLMASSGRFNISMPSIKRSTQGIALIAIVAFSGEHDFGSGKVTKQHLTSSHHIRLQKKLRKIPTAS